MRYLPGLIHAGVAIAGGVVIGSTFFEPPLGYVATFVATFLIRTFLARNA